MEKKESQDTVALGRYPLGEISGSHFFTVRSALLQPHIIRDIFGSRICMPKNLGEFIKVQFLRLEPILALCIAISIGDAANQVSAQTYQSSRTPAVVGTVVDLSWADWNDPAERLEPGIMIGRGHGTVVGREDGAVRKAVLEFDISDLVPGVVESARISGTLVPVERNPTGDRRVDSRILVGDGVVGLDDNDQRGNFSGGVTTYDGRIGEAYDYEITSQFRRFMLDEPDYIKQLMLPRNRPQGLDTVSNPVLELELRPTNNVTSVYYEKPTASAAIHTVDDELVSLDTSASAFKVSNFAIAPFNHRSGLMEFDLSSIPKDAIVDWAKLEVHVGGLTSDGSTLEVVGYHGDGIITPADVVNPGYWLSTIGQISSLGLYTWDISLDLISSALKSDSHVGLHFQPGDSSLASFDITLNSPTTLSWEPRLALAYIIPEPISGDFDDDRDIDGADFLAWQRDPSVGSVTEWKSYYATAAQLSSIQVEVPEPVSIVFVALSLLGMGCQRSK